MFDLISREDDAVPQQDAVPLLISIAAHLVMIGAVAAIPLQYVSAELPGVPDIPAFVATAAPPPPPPPPPPVARAPVRVGGAIMVESVMVLRSILLLDRAAIEAVRQWRYSPLLLNGQPERFVLAVTVNFSLKV